MATEAQAGTAPHTAQTAAVTAERSLGRLSPTGRFYAGLALGSLALGALSLLFPSTPSYDPWSWLLWAREIVHGHLTITSSGTSWKPLPMVFTIPFALLGGAAPNLWLMVARAGAIAAVVMVFRLSWRLTRRVGGLFGEASGRAIEIGPALVAGLIGSSVLLLSASGAFLSANALGYSEALAAALLMIAIERLIDGRPRQSFIVGFFVALDRPEIWLFWGVLGLWLLWRDPGARVLVVASAVVVLAAWFLPVKLGCGSFTCSVNRALKPRSNSLAFASSPFEAELSEAAWPTMLLRIKVPAGLLVLAVAGLSLREWRQRGLAALAAPRNRARIVTAGLAIGGLAWFVVIAVMTQIGFSGNNRYLVLGSALVDVCGSVAFGWAARELGVLAMRGLRHRRTANVGHGAAEQAPAATQAATGQAGSATAAALQWAAAGLMALLFMFGPNWVGPNLISFPRTHRALVYQANLRKGLGQLVSLYGGPAKVLACGSVMTEGFQVPMVSWGLGVATTRIEAPPDVASEAGPAPNVILQTRDTGSAALLPVLASWPNVHYHYVGTRGPIHMFTHCQG